jgi:hypothetical protein
VRPKIGLAPSSGSDSSDSTAGQLCPEDPSGADLPTHKESHHFQDLMTEERAILKVTKDLKGECVLPDFLGLQEK